MSIGYINSLLSIDISSPGSGRSSGRMVSGVSNGDTPLVSSGYLSDSGAINGADSGADQLEPSHIIPMTKAGGNFGML